MNYRQMVRKITNLSKKYDCKKKDICLIIELADGDSVVATLCDVDVYETPDGKYGIDLIAG